MRIGRVRDEADAGGEEARVVAGAVDGAREFGRERSADGGDVDADLLEHAALHYAAHAAPAIAGAAVARAGLLAVPGDEREGRVAARLALDRLERGTDAIPQRLEPVARRVAAQDRR